MSYPSSAVTTSSAAGQSGRRIVPAQAIQSAISVHQQNSAWIQKVPPRDELEERDTEWRAVSAAYRSGKMTHAEYSAARARILDADRAYDRRVGEYLARREAGQTTPGEFFRVFYGCTDAQAQEWQREEVDAARVWNANVEARSRSRVAQQSRHGQGH